MKQYQYKVHHTPLLSVAELNRLGAEGWELVESNEDSGGMYSCLLIREIEPDSPMQGPVVKSEPPMVRVQIDGLAGVAIARDYVEHDAHEIMEFLRAAPFYPYYAGAPLDSPKVHEGIHSWLTNPSEAGQHELIVGDVHSVGFVTLQRDYSPMQGPIHEWDVDRVIKECEAIERSNWYVEVWEAGADDYSSVCYGAALRELAWGLIHRPELGGLRVDTLRGVFEEVEMERNWRKPDSPLWPYTVCWVKEDKVLTLKFYPPGYVKNPGEPGHKE